MSDELGGEGEGEGEGESDGGGEGESDEEDGEGEREDREELEKDEDDKQGCSVGGNGGLQDTSNIISLSLVLHTNFCASLARGDWTADCGMRRSNSSNGCACILGSRTLALCPISLLQSTAMLMMALQR